MKELSYSDTLHVSGAGNSPFSPLIAIAAGACGFSHYGTHCVSIAYDVSMLAIGYAIEPPALDFIDLLVASLVVSTISTEVQYQFGRFLGYMLTPSAPQ